MLKEKRKERKRKKKKPQKLAWTAASDLLPDLSAGLE